MKNNPIFHTSKTWTWRHMLVIYWLLALWKQTWWRHRHTRKVSKNQKKQNGRQIQFFKIVFLATKYTEYIVNKATGMFTFLYPRSQQPYNNIKIKLGIFGPLLKLEKLSSDSTVWRDLSFKTIVFVSGVVKTNPNNCLQQPCYHAKVEPGVWGKIPGSAISMGSYQRDAIDVTLCKQIPAVCAPQGTSSYVASILIDKTRQYHTRHHHRPINSTRHEWIGTELIVCFQYIYMLQIINLI